MIHSGSRNFGLKIADYYNKLAKHHEYYCDALNNWTWFAMGHYMPMDDLNIYPYFPASFKGRRYNYKSNEAQQLGRKCGKRLLLLFIKYGR